ncbi:Phage terminase, large subunit, PBSX [Roseobacter sp. AzwK-3b]|uniref:terminase large subunit domain-containing protein n=1 Tax=Roseobacter sp. AzwK-3b TaxID=351016 RepID=UPI000156A4E8|nr:terminase family protein [Roseobacter sp. AzwK-3b]EDM70824.1 Phage terminase, large subunit, PBSX [Roseobacter sp. AzwK-3b]
MTQAVRKIDMDKTQAIWNPTDRQTEFLSAGDFEVLYGGAAGGGKSDALLVDALCLQHEGHKNPRHRAVLFRRSFPELRDLISRSLEIYNQVDPFASYNATEKVWTLSSGAKIEFGYLHNDADRLKYRGRAWNYIGFDELTLWPTDVCYLYLFSRCRSTDQTLPRYIRATTNPDGPGQLWVMKRWGIQEDGSATRIPVDVEDKEKGVTTTFHRTFIPARLSENPHLSETGYREALLQLAPDERDALLMGLWRQGRVHGAYYANEMAEMRNRGGIRSVPYDPSEPVNTFWDLGWNDTTAIWFHQQIAGEHRFIRAYENSGESLDHYATYLQNSGFNLMGGRHYLPHDARNKSLQTGKSALEILQEMLPNLNFEVVPRIQNILTGINQTRLAMRGKVFIDATECPDGIAALDNYRKAYNERHDVFTERPLHDRYSNFADAFRQWGQALEEGLTGPRQQFRRKPKPPGGMWI